MLFIDSNHENFYKLYRYPTEAWRGGRVHKIRSHVRSFLVASGNALRGSALENLRKADFKVDYVITHTAPSETVYYLPTLRSLGIKNDVVQEQPLTSFFDEIQRKVTYKHWSFGHFHVDLKLWRNQKALLSSVRWLEIRKIALQCDPYEG